MAAANQKVLGRQKQQTWVHCQLEETRQRVQKWDDSLRTNVCFL